MTAQSCKLRYNEYIRICDAHNKLLKGNIALKLDQYLGSLPAPESTTIRQRLDWFAQHSGQTGQFVHNIYVESRLDANAWREILAHLLNTSLDAVTVKELVMKTCQMNVLSGGLLPTPPPWPLRYGRTVTCVNFRQHVLKQCPHLTPNQVDRFVKRLPKRTLAQTRADMRDLPLSVYAMWATFCDADRDGDPFQDLPNGAEELRAALGLHPDCGDIYLFDYSLPTGIVPYVPTVADACAGSYWFELFRPALADASFGRTQPWPNYNVVGRPEVIHQSITGATQETPIRLAKGR